MRIEEQEQAIFEIQRFLYELSLYFDWLPNVFPNGVYDETTKEAVEIFQSRFDLPITGEVNFETWNLLFATYSEVLNKRTETPVPSLPLGDFPLQIGSKGYGVVLLRATLNALSEYYPILQGGAPTSVYQYSTATAVRELEKIYGLPETGAVNLFLWNKMFLDLASKNRIKDYFSAINATSPFLGP